MKQGGTFRIDGRQSENHFADILGPAGLNFSAASQFFSLGRELVAGVSLCAWCCYDLSLAFGLIALMVVCMA